MSFLTLQIRAVKVWFDDDNIWLRLEDGRQISAPLGFYPRLLNATNKQRKHFSLIGGGRGIHWPDLDEDISVEGLLAGRRSAESNKALAKWLEKRGKC